MMHSSEKLEPINFFDGIQKIHVLKIYKFSKCRLNFLVIGIPISSSRREDN